MLEANTSDVSLARQQLADVVASAELRRHAELENFLTKHVDSNRRIPEVVRAHLRGISKFESQDDKTCFELLDSLWEKCAKISELRWSNLDGGQLIAQLDDGEVLRTPVLWAKSHFKQHHAKAIARLSTPAREALDWILSSPGSNAWEQIGQVKTISEDGLVIQFEMRDLVQRYERPLSCAEFFDRFSQSIHAMSYEAQSLIYSGLPQHQLLGKNLEAVYSLSEDQDYHFVKVGIQTEAGSNTYFFYQTQELEEFQLEFQNELNALPDKFLQELSEFMQDGWGPWLHKGRIASVRLTHLNTVEMKLREGGVVRFHPRMPTAEFIEAVLPELTDDQPLRHLVMRALNENEQDWCRYGFADKLQWHIGGAAELISAYSTPWYLFEPQTVEQFLESSVRGRSDLSERAQAFIEEFAGENPEYFDKRGLVFSVKEEREQDQVVLETLLTGCEVARMPIPK